ncbi:hypothetical protein ACFL9T_16080 [Thermodesulfobacteriota bacterium]
MSANEKPKAKLHMRYPWSSILIYNGSTIAHYLLGGIGIIIGYGFSSWAGYLFGLIYLSFSFVEMYVIMPLTVCPNCVYYQMEAALCISGLNVISKKITNEGDQKDFVKRAEGLFCFNNMYIAALIIPIIALIPALIVNYAVSLLAIFLALVALLLFRFFVIFPKIACLHCFAKYKCPQAGSMGVREL